LAIDAFHADHRQPAGQRSEYPDQIVQQHYRHEKHHKAKGKQADAERLRWKVRRNSSSRYLSVAGAGKKNRV